MGQQVGGALGGRQEASFECVLGKVSRLQRGRQRWSAFALPRGPWVRCCAEFPWATALPGLPALFLFSLVDQGGPHPTEDHASHVGLGCPLVATGQFS